LLLQTESTVRYGDGQRKRLDGCFQTESTVRYGGGQRKRLGGFEFFTFKQSPRSAMAVVNANGWAEFCCFQTESTVRYGGGQRKRLGSCFQAESTVRYGGGQREWLDGFEFFAFEQRPRSATAVVNANGWAAAFKQSPRFATAAVNTNL
jgi:hypothetical protein